MTQSGLMARRLPVRTVSRSCMPCGIRVLRPDVQELSQLHDEPEIGHKAFAITSGWGNYRTYEQPIDRGLCPVALIFPGIPTNKHLTCTLAGDSLQSKGIISCVSCKAGSLTYWKS